MKKASPNSYRKWMAFAVGGLLLIGFGISLTGEAILIKSQTDNFWIWGAWGSFALIVLNSGISLFGRAVIERIKILKEEDRL
jgi:divalent metal cation (Fe/Co/Zn/Cd) transporter